MADDVLRQGVRGISDIITIPGLVNVDFADVRAVMTGAGSSLMGQGIASGKDRARDAARAAISSPLLDVGIDRAKGIVWNVTGPPDMTLAEVNAAAEVVYDLVDPEANLIFGAVVDPSIQTGELSITLIATGFGGAGLAGSAVAPFVERRAPAAAPVVAAVEAETLAQPRAAPAPASKGALDIVVPAFLRRNRK